MKKSLLLILMPLILPFASFSQNNAEAVKMNAITDFSLVLREGKAPNRLPYTPFHIEKEWNALAGDDLNFPFHMASAEGRFPGKAGVYTVTLNTLTERDGECAYNVYVNDKPVGLCRKNPPTNEFCVPAMLQWTGVEIPSGAIIRVESNSYSNLRRPEAGFFEYARGRWTGIAFIPVQKNEIAKLNSSDQGVFSQCISVGASAIKPEMIYHTPDNTCFLIAGGTGLNNKKDSFGYLFKQVSGDFILETGIRLLGISSLKSGSAGIMMRESSDAGARFISCLVQNDGVVKLQYRPAAGDVIKEILFKVAGAEMIQLERKGDSCIVSAAKFGEIYERNSVELAGLKDTSTTGFFVCSGSDKEKEAAAFTNLRFYEFSPR